MDESVIRSALVLRDAIERAPSVLPPIGSYRVVIRGHQPCPLNVFLSDDEVPPTLYRSLQSAVGVYLDQITVPEVASFASAPSLPVEIEDSPITFILDSAGEHVALNGVSADLLRRIYDKASPATFGDLAAMETRVDPLVRSGRELVAGKFAVSPQLCDWVGRTWSQHFQPPNVRVEPYKINIYGPGDRFAMHRDTPEAGLVGTFLVALKAWGPPCEGGGLAVHDAGGCHRWGGGSGWAAFHPYLPHEVAPVAEGARMTVAFKVFATDEGATSPDFDDAVVAEAAQRVAVCCNELGQVGVLLSFAYSFNGSSLCGRDVLIHRILAKLGTVESVPVAVRIAAKPESPDAFYWSTEANVFSLRPENLTAILDPEAPSRRAPSPWPRISFIPLTSGHAIYDRSSQSIDWTGNYAEPANVNTLYVHRALIMSPSPTRPAEAVKLARIDLRRVDLSGRSLDGVDLEEADLGGATLAAASLRGAKLRLANMGKSNLAGANLSLADLSGTDMWHASLAGASLRGAVITNADLSGANLEGADLTETDLSGVASEEDGWVTLEDVVWNMATKWPDGFNPVTGCSTIPTDKTLSLAQIERLLGFMAANGAPQSLHLDTLIDLPEGAAQRLAQYEGDLSLNGLATLSEDDAVSLSTHIGGWLSLDGLTALSNSGARALAGYKGTLSLASLMTLTSPELARRLVSDITKEAVDSHRYVSESEEECVPPWPHFGEVSLPSVTELSAESARAIVDEIKSVSNEYPDLYSDMYEDDSIDGSLVLDSLHLLSPEAAKELARHRGYLGLGGLQSISAGTAEALACMGRYTLNLSGLAEMPADVVEALAKHKGYIRLTEPAATLAVASGRFRQSSLSPAMFEANRRK